MEQTIVIVDDHILIARALTAIVAHFPGFRVLYECENGQVLIEHFKQPAHVPDIVLLDIVMPVMDGFATAVWLKENHPGVLVMALTMQQDDASLLKMVQCGVKGYLQKNIHPIEFEKALQTLVEKGLYFPDWATARVFKNLGSGKSSDTLGIQLSEREKEFLGWACTELTYKEIGAHMFCSARTVEGYRDALFEKLGMKTRVALALYAAKIGLHKLS